MAVRVSSSKDGGTVTIAVSDRFDFNVHREFREAYRSAEGGKVNYVVDLSGTEYMDSSALGMLLLLREHGGGDRSTVAIVNPGENIRKILKISNFDRLFEIR